jgi:hypothetical protein
VTAPGSAPDRLFVPLAGGPFDWFAGGSKVWELRKAVRQYTTKHVRVGRRVELRRGYSGGRSLWGTIVEVVEAESAEVFFCAVAYSAVLPLATDKAAAVAAARDYVGEGVAVIAFRVELDPAP